MVVPPDECAFEWCTYRSLARPIDGNGKAIGEAIQFNLSSLRVMAGTVPEQRVAEIKVIEGSQCTAEDILREVQSLPLSYDDSIFCHYSGHGAYDPAAAVAEDKSNGHHFQIESGALMRYELWQALKKHDVRLTVLMTDTCNPLARANAWVHAGDFRSGPMHRLTRISRNCCWDTADQSTSARAEMGQYAWYSINLDEFVRPGPVGRMVYGGSLQRVATPTTGRSHFPAAARTLTNNDYKERKARLLAGGVDDLTKEALEEQLDMTPVHFVFDVVRDDQALEPRDAPVEARMQSFSTWDIHVARNGVERRWPIAIHAAGGAWLLYAAALALVGFAGYSAYQRWSYAPIDRNPATLKAKSSRSGLAGSRDAIDAGRCLHRSAGQAMVGAGQLE